MTVQVIRPTPRLVKPDPWPLDPGRVVPEGQWAWEKDVAGLVPLWNGAGTPFDVHNGLQATEFTSTWSRTKQGMAVEATQSGDIVRFPTPDPMIDHTGSMTFAAVLLPLNSFASGGSPQRVIYWGSILDNPALMLAHNQNNENFSIRYEDVNNGRTNVSAPNGTAPNGQIHTAVGVLDLGAGQSRVYTNGVLNSTGSFNGIDSGHINNTEIGLLNRTTSTNRTFPGMVILSMMYVGAWQDWQAQLFHRDPFAPFRPQYYRFFEEEAADDGTTTVTLTDSLAFNENLDRDFEGDRSVSDDLTLNENQVGNLTAERDDQGDTLGFAENLQSDKVLTRLISDDLSLTEQLVIDRILTRLIEDSLGFAENLDRTVTQSGGAITRTITDTIAFAENLLRDVDLDRLMNENLTFSENLDIIVNDSPISQAVERHWRFQRFQNLRRERRWSDESDMWDS